MEKVSASTVRFTDLPENDVGGVANTAPERGITNIALTDNPAIFPTGRNESSRATALISNANGSPAIAHVEANFSPEDMAAILMSLHEKTQQGQLRTASEGLGVGRLKIQSTHKKAMEKLELSIKKGASAESKSKCSKIFGWIGKIAAVVGTAITTIGLIVATPFSAGATAPLLALSIIGLVGATISLASAISKEAGGPPLELSSLMNKACMPLLKLVGVPQDKLESASRIMAGSLGIITGAIVIDSQFSGDFAAGIIKLSTNSENAAMYTGMAVTMLTGLATTIAKGLASGGSGAVADVTEVTENIGKISEIAEKIENVSTLAKNFQQMGDIAKYSTEAISAAGQIATGGMGIKVALDEHAAATAQVDRQKFSMLIVKLQSQMQEDQDEIKHVTQQMQDGYNAVSQMILGANQSRMQIAANLSSSKS